MNILCVDDDADDQFFLSDALIQVNPGIRILQSANGRDALGYLDHVKNGGDDLPGLIILDINMPYLDGRQTLERLKADPVLSSIPVVVFTSSENPNDHLLFKSLGVDLYTKPVDLEYMNDIASSLLAHCSK